MPTHVWPREGEQPCRQDEAAIDAAIDDFLSEAHAAAPIFAGMVVEIMPETSSAPPDIRKRWWGLVGTAVTRQGGGGAGTGDHGDRVMLGAPRTGTRAIPVERSRVAKSIVFHVRVLDAWAAADSKDEHGCSAADLEQWNSRTRQLHGTGAAEAQHQRSA